MRIWTFEAHCRPSPRPSAFRPCPGGGGLEVRGVAAEALLHCEPVPGRRAALPVQTLIGFDTASRRREEAFLLLFFFSLLSSISKRNAPPLLQLPLDLLCCSPSSSALSLFHSALFIPVTPSFFILRLKPADFCFFCLALSFCPSRLDVDQ